MTIDLTGNVADMGDDDIGISMPNLQSRQFKDVLRRHKAGEARASEGEDMAHMAGYGMSSAAELDAHLASHHGGGNVRNPAQSHMRYHVEYKNPLGPVHDH